MRSKTEGTKAKAESILNKAGWINESIRQVEPDYGKLAAPLLRRSMAEKVDREMGLLLLQIDQHSMLEYERTYGLARVWVCGWEIGTSAALFKVEVIHDSMNNTLWEQGGLGNIVYVTKEEFLSIKRSIRDRIINEVYDKFLFQDPSSIILGEMITVVALRRQGTPPNWLRWSAHA